MMNYVQCKCSTAMHCVLVVVFNATYLAREEDFEGNHRCSSIIDGSHGMGRTELSDMMYAP